MAFDSIQALTLGQTLYASRKKIQPSELLGCWNLNGTNENLSRWDSTCSLQNASYATAGVWTFANSGTNSISGTFALEKALKIGEDWSFEALTYRNASYWSSMAVTIGPIHIRTGNVRTYNRGLWIDGTQVSTAELVNNIEGVAFISFSYSASTGTIHAYGNGVHAWSYAVDLSSRASVSSIVISPPSNGQDGTTGIGFGMVRVCQKLVNQSTIASSYPVPTVPFTGYEAL